MGRWDQDCKDFLKARTVQSPSHSLCACRHAPRYVWLVVGRERRPRLAIRVGSGAEGRRERDRWETSRESQILKSDNCFHLVLITGTNADGNPQVLPARTSSLAPSRKAPIWLAGPSRVRYLPEACLRSLLLQKCWNCNLELMAEANSPPFRGLQLWDSGFQSVEWTQPSGSVQLWGWGWTSLCTREDYQVLYLLSCTKQPQS